MESAERYEFHKKLKFLQSLKGQGTELITILIPSGSGATEVVNKLREEAGQAQNIKSKQTRKNVASAIDRLLHALKGYTKVPENGVAFFCGSVDDRIELYSIIPPEPLTIQTYRCSSTFFLEPLLEMLEPKEMYGLMTVDRREATIALLKGKKIEIVKSKDSQVPSKHRAGGQSAARFESLIEIAANEWFHKIGDLASDTFKNPKVSGVLVGGPGPTKHYFLKGDYLSAEVQRKVIGTIDTSYTDEFGIREITEKAGDVRKELEITKEKQLLERFLKEASLGQLATYGEAEVRTALEQGKVETLLISEENPWQVFFLKCQQCGEGKKIVAREKPTMKCKKCSNSMKIEDVKDLIEDFAALAETTSTKVEVISNDTPEGQQFRKGFGGIGALLRFK